MMVARLVTAREGDGTIRSKFPPQRACTPDAAVLSFTVFTKP